MSQIGTTIEQSKRLIEAGLNRETADMVWYKAVNRRSYLAVMGEVPFWECEAWSLSHLWDLLSESNITLEYATNRSSEALIESIVTAVERFAKQGRI